MAIGKIRRRFFGFDRLDAPGENEAPRKSLATAADRGERGPPLLDAAQWAALKAVCD